VASPTATPPRLPNSSVRPGVSSQRIAPPGQVQGLTSKRQPLPRIAPMAPTNLFFDTPTGAVDQDALQPLSVTGDVIDVTTITAGNIVAGTITGNEIAANTITGAHIVAGSIDASTIIASGSITTPLLAAGAVTTDKIAAGAVTADKITVTQLSAITADMGSITAGTITGGVIQTGVGNPHVKLDASGIEMTDPSGVVTFRANSATGVLTLGNPAGSRFQFDPALLSGQRLYLEGQLVGTGTIMGPSFTTSLSNPRVVMDSSGINAYPASSYPTTGILDDFNRANAGPPPSDLWDTTVSGNGHDLRYSNAPGLLISSGAAKAAADGEASMRWSAVLASADNEAYCTLNQVAYSVEVWARHEGRADVNTGSPWGYLLFWSGSGQNLRLQKYGPGGGVGWVDLTAAVAIPGGAVNGMKLGIRCLGTAITGWYQKPGGAWTQILTVSDSTFTTGPQVGVLVYQQFMVIDDFGGGVYVAGGAGGGVPSFTLDSQTGTVSMTGGTLTAAQLQTATSNPRIVFNASGITSLLADGSVPFKVDAATGGVTAARLSVSGYLAGAGRITFDQKGMPPGSATFMSLNRNQLGGGAELWNTSSDDQGAVSQWGKASVRIQGGGASAGAYPLGRAIFDPAGTYVQRYDSATAGEYLQLSPQFLMLRTFSPTWDQRLFIGSAGAELWASMTGPIGLHIDPGASSVSYLTVNASGGASRFRFQRGTAAAPGGIIDYYDGNWIMANASGGPSQREIINTDPSFYCSLGARFWATAASQSMGAFAQYRQVRGNTVAAQITPGAATISVAILNANTTAAAVINAQRPEGCQISFTSAAAGATYYYAQVVFS